MTADMLSALVASLSESPSLTEVRLVAACLLAFSAFLRYDEVAKLRCCDVTFGPQNMTIRILSSKNDQYRQGDRVLVASTCSPTCPVAMLECYYELASLSTVSKLQLSRGIVVTKSLRSQDSLSYTRLRELFLNKLAELGFDPKQFGCIVCDRVEPQLQQMRASRIDCLNAMVGGGQSQPRMVMLKTLLVLCCQCLRA